jgi:hypothetical protein
MGYTIVSISILEEQIKHYNKLLPEDVSFYLSLVTTVLPLGAIIGS